MLNKVVLMGRFTKDPELRSTGQGTSVASFFLAVDRDFKGKNGERETDFIPCVAWKGKAEFISKYFCKGSMAVVEGSIQTRSWDKPDGGKGYATEVIVSNIYFGESKRDNSPATETPEASNYGYDDDLPC
jgi:single-strand DNA-binding protein